MAFRPQSSVHSDASWQLVVGVLHSSPSGWSNIRAVSTSNVGRIIGSCCTCWCLLRFTYVIDTRENATERFRIFSEVCPVRTVNGF